MKKKPKKNLVLLYGGQSTEREISLVSAEFVFNSADRNLFNVLPVRIERDGTWKLMKINPFCERQKGVEVFPVPRKGGSCLFFTGSRKKNISVDAVFPVLHGALGEDGTVQGFFRILNLPFVGADVLGSAISMDKEVSKKLLEHGKLPICKYICHRKNSDLKPSFESVKKKLGSPFFVKPSNSGSSVGVGKIRSKEQFTEMVENAFKFSEKIIFEEFIEGREIECAVLGNEEPKASIAGEILVKSEFYSYRAKYIDKDSARIIYPADLPGKISREVRRLAVEAFKCLYCEGMARVDFFIRGDEIFINEINTIPGFTSISMYPKLWEVTGVDSRGLITRLVELALQRHERERVLSCDFKETL
ncbi:D-alanine--D-alanine ligase [candidate division WOR-3 bacterium]|nr:D-alanine--D-alanine ligase [candidate division WOR-3 bacterium]